MHCGPDFCFCIQRKELYGHTYLSVPHSPHCGHIYLPTVGIYIYLCPHPLATCSITFLCSHHPLHCWEDLMTENTSGVHTHFFKASQPRGPASGSRAYERHEMQGVILKCSRHERSVFVNLRPHLLHIRSRHQFSLPEKNRLPLRDLNPRSSVYQMEHITTLPRGRPEGRV